MIFGRINKNSLIKRTIYVFTIVLLCLAQNTAGFFPEAFGARAFLLVPAIVCIAMFEKETAGMLFGLFAGLLWDVFASGGTFNAIFLTAVGFLCGILVSNLVRNNIITASIFSAISILFYSTIYWLIKILPSATESAVQIFISFYLPSALYTFLLFPFIYLFVRYISRVFVSEGM